MKSPLPTSERLRRLFAYDRANGVLISRRFGVPVGSRHNSGYLTVTVDKRSLRVHRIIWLFETGSWPTGLIDHKDGNPLNNRFDNLREATAAQNAANSVVRSDNKLGVKGVRTVKKRTLRYRAMIRTNGIQKHIGYFDTAAEAHAAYCEAADRYHGEFSCSGSRGAPGPVTGRGTNLSPAAFIGTRGSHR